jgi:hypothetical protein
VALAAAAPGGPETGVDRRLADLAVTAQEHTELKLAGLCVQRILKDVE